MTVINLSRKETYGNLTNRIAEKHCLFAIDYEVKVGMGATEYMWSDRHPYSVVEVFKNWNNKGYDIIALTQDDYERTDNLGMSDDQDYKFTTRPDGNRHYLKSILYKTKDGLTMKMFEPVRFNTKTNRWNKGGSNIKLGHRSKYHDFSF
jgi:hypothetical protein